MTSSATKQDKLPSSAFPKAQQQSNLKIKTQ